MSPNPISLAIVAVLAAFGILLIVLARLIVPGAMLIVSAVIMLAALRMAQQWEEAVVLRAGKFLAVKGPGLFGIVPILDSVTALIDTRLRTTQFVAEQTLTKDTVPVDVDAIIFWMVTDVRRAALEVASYGEAISWAAQTSLREMIGAADLAMLLSNRKAIDEELRQTIDGKTAEWGIVVKSVEIRDVTIPAALQDAMSREAQAERERQARVILGAARGRDRPQLRRGGAELCRQPGGVALARHEHALRERQRARQHDHRAEQCCRQHEPRRPRRHHLAGQGTGHKPAEWTPAAARARRRLKSAPIKSMAGPSAARRVPSSPKRARKRSY